MPQCSPWALCRDPVNHLLFCVSHTLSELRSSTGPFGYQKSLTSFKRHHIHPVPYPHPTETAITTSSPNITSSGSLEFATRATNPANRIRLLGDTDSMLSLPVFAGVCDYAFANWRSGSRNHGGFDPTHRRGTRVDLTWRSRISLSQLQSVGFLHLYLGLKGRCLIGRTALGYTCRSCSGIRVCASWLRWTDRHRGWFPPRRYEIGCLLVHLAGCLDSECSGGIWPSPRAQTQNLRLGLRDGWTKRCAYRYDHHHHLN